MGFKYTMEERKNVGRDESKKDIVKLEEIKKILCQCLEENKIDGDVVLVGGKQKIEYEELMKEYGMNSSAHIIWVEFASTGHVAVVGAGKDIGFPRSGNTYDILSYVISDDKKWDDSKIIIIPIRGLDPQSNGKKHVTNILKCRNGVEHCIGDYLLEKNVPILNLQSHKNYTDEFWKKCVNNNYELH